MSAVQDAIHQLVGRTAGVAADDLPCLVEIHAQLQALGAMFEAESLAGFRQSSGRLERLAEQIVLRDVDDAEVAILQLVRGVAELQLAVDGGGAPEGSDAPPSPAQAVESQPPAPLHATPCEDQTLSADDLPLVHEFVTEAGGHIELAEASLLKLEANPGDAEAVNAVFRSFHTIKGVAGFLNLKQIGSLAHASENLLDLARQGKRRLTGATLDTVLAALDGMKSLIGRVAAAAQNGSSVVADPAIPQLVERIAATASGKETAPPVATEKPSVPAGAPQAAASTTEATVKVATDRLDNLINTVGELVIAQAMVAQASRAMLAADPKLARNLTHVAKITRELQELSMAMRMVPIQGTFQKMSRLVRDLARKTGKEIELSLVGGETELDRNVVEAVTDPLVHMVRNAADHGIETPDKRELAGKPRAGRIELRARHHSGSIVIEIADDGRGLNKEKLLKKAIAAGIVAEGAELSESEIFKLVFHAGLSTAEKVTDVSGRGVGMDVVKKNVEALRGRIDIASVEGNGATFTIRLPLTLAVIDGLVVKVGAARFILPILSVEQSLRPQPGQVSTVQGRGEVCVVRESLLPLYRLHDLLNLTPVHRDPTQALVVIVQDDSRRCCLLVDELLGQQQVVIKSLGSGLGDLRGVSGGAILGDGNVSLILDVPGLMDLASTQASPSSKEPK